MDVFAQVAHGSLDVLTQRNLREIGAEAQAADALAFYRGRPGDRDQWRLAADTNGRRIGCIIPARSAYDASVSDLGVIPQHRGQGYVDALLAESTHLPASAGALRITGTTDPINAPMAAAFLRSGDMITNARVGASAPPEARRVIE